MRFGARVSKTPCQNRNPWVQGLARCFAYACTNSHPNRSKFGGNIAQIGAHQFSLSSINFVINSTPQGPWERKDQKTRVTPYPRYTAPGSVGLLPWRRRVHVVDSQVGSCPTLFGSGLASSLGTPPAIGEGVLLESGYVLAHT